MNTVARRSVPECRARIMAVLQSQLCQEACISQIRGPQTLNLQADSYLVNNAATRAKVHKAFGARISLRVTGAVAGMLLLALEGISAPINDNFANRTQLSGVSAVTNGTNVDATKEPGEPDHAGNIGGKSVWWSWTAPFSGIVRIKTDGSGFNTTL